MNQVKIIQADVAIEVMERISKNEICGKCLTETFTIDTSKYCCEEIGDYKKCRRIICGCGNIDLWIDEDS